jgi:membrane-bound lytic murein transglycosylase C
MQIVPISAGQDATAEIYGKARILSPSYLYNTENNVKVGAAYFNILFYRYFRNITDPRTRLYCSIAAYNTGPGNVAKALTGDSMSLKAATRVANTMNPDEMYRHLMSNLPYKETVHYLRKVTSRLQKYETALAAKES